MSNESAKELGELSALSADIERLVGVAGPWVVAVNGRHRVPSTGIVWRPGQVVTAAHTLKRDTDITLTFSDGQAAAATVAGRDPGTDLALLRFEGVDAEQARPGNAGRLRVGHLAVVVGRHGEGQPSAGLAMIGAVGDAYRTWRGGQIDRFVRIDVALYPGLSGAPVVDGSGEVVGLATAGIARGMAVAIPTSTIERVVDELARRGRVGRAFLGVGMQPVRLPSAALQAAGLAGDGGVIVLGVEPNGPAERAGLLLGDVIVSLDGTRVQDPEDVLALLGGERIGRPLRARVLRAGAVFELDVTVGEWPARRA